MLLPPHSSLEACQRWGSHLGHWENAPALWEAQALTPLPPLPPGQACRDSFTPRYASYKLVTQPQLIQNNEYRQSCWSPPQTLSTCLPGARTCTPPWPPFILWTLIPFRSLSRRSPPTTLSRVAPSPVSLSPILYCHVNFLSKTCLYLILWTYLLIYYLSGIITSATRSPRVWAPQMKGPWQSHLAFVQSQNGPGTPVGTDLLNQQRKGEMLGVGDAWCPLNPSMWKHFTLNYYL